MWNIIATILVFAVIAVGLVEVYQNFGAGQAQQTAQALSQEATTTAAQIASVFSGNPDFSNIATAAVSLVPSNWTSSGGGVFALPEGGTVTFTPQKLNGATTDNAYQMDFQNLNQNECQALAGFVTQKTEAINVNGTTAGNPIYGGGTTTPAWGSNLVYLCTANSSTNTVAVNIMG